MKYLILLGALIIGNANADINSDEIAQADEAIQSPSLDIQGQYKVKEVEVKIEPVALVKEIQTSPPVIPAKKITQSEKMKIYRERLEERNKIMVEKKIEQIRFKQELALARQIQQSMNKTLQAIDSVKN